MHGTPEGNGRIEIEAGMEFGPEQFATFAPIVPAIVAFGEEHGLRVSRVFDKDPVAPGACYHLSWPRSNIRISAADPIAFGDRFVIHVSGPRRAFKERWDYTTAEGPEKLRAILQEAKALCDRDALTPEEEAASAVRHREALARVQEKIEQMQREEPQA